MGPCLPQPAAHSRFPHYFQFRPLIILQCISYSQSIAGIQSWGSLFPGAGGRAAVADMMGHITTHAITPCFQNVVRSVMLHCPQQSDIRPALPQHVHHKYTPPYNFVHLYRYPRHSRPLVNVTRSIIGINFSYFRGFASRFVRER